MILIAKNVIAALLVLLVFITQINKMEGMTTGEKLHNKNEYVCMPCGRDCDKTVYYEPGTCSHCSMELVLKKSITNAAVKPSELCNFINKKGAANIVLLDVRTREEFNGTAQEKYGRLKNAINIPIQELNSRMAELEKYKEMEIVVYCSHSHRSPRASYMLTQNGFAKVTNMLYGMSEWKQQVTNKDCNQQLYIKQ